MSLIVKPPIILDQWEAPGLMVSRIRLADLKTGEYGEPSLLVHGWPGVDQERLREMHEMSLGLR